MFLKVSEIFDTGRQRLSSIGKSEAVDLGGSEISPDPGDEHIYISGVSISRTPEPPAATGKQSKIYYFL